MEIQNHSDTPKRISARLTRAPRPTQVRTYGDIFADYAHHPESKRADEHGNTCDRPTVGLLYRRHVRIGKINFVGKESNKLEEVDAGLIHSAESVYTTYSDPTRDAWERIIRPKLQKISLSLLTAKSGVCRRMIVKYRRGHARPHARNRQLIADAVNKFFAEAQKIPAKN